MASGSLCLVRHKIFHNYGRQFIYINREAKFCPAALKSVDSKLLLRSNSNLVSNINILGSFSVNNDTHENSINIKRNQIFNEERKRQKDLIPRVEKIQVQYEGTPESMKLLLKIEVHYVLFWTTRQVFPERREL